MDFVADLHLHSRYARAVSPSMTLPVIRAYAMQKGIDLVAAPDFTHPVWMKEMEGQLEEAGEGVYRLKSQISNVKVQINSKDQNEKREPLFLLSTEIACIYKQGEKLRRIHNLVMAPSIETAQKVSTELTRRGCNLRADGRPIVGLSAKNLLELILSIDKKCLLIPAHIWTPHFGIYGSASGFESLEEAFGQLAPYVYGIETGLSSDPEMNWEVKELQHRSILSFSDAHSPAKMGRELTVFALQEASYEHVRSAIMRDPSMGDKIKYTIEFYPEEGKYHFSGHRKCGVSLGPEKIKANGNICPICKRRLTEGVLYRVAQLVDDSLRGRVQLKMSPFGIKWYIDSRKIQPPYVKLVPLNEIVAASLGLTVASLKTKTLFETLCTTLGSEVEILLKTPIGAIGKVGGEKVAQAVEKVRRGDVVVEPGFDGEYGKVEIFVKETGEKEQLGFL